MIKIKEMLKIAEIHKQRIDFAATNLKNIFPMTAEKINNLSSQELLYIEMLTGRFAKLQDYIGAKLIDGFLTHKGEVFNNLSVIDKMNLLEKLGVFSSANVWLEMRELRNHLAHEYPDNPEITAEYLNRVFTMLPELLGYLEKIKSNL